MDKQKQYLLITNSTALAGSTLTLGQNTRLLDEGISSEGKTIAEQLLNLDLKAAYDAAVKDAENHQMWSSYRVKILAGKALKSYGFDFNTVHGESALQELCHEANEARMHSRTLKEEGLYAASFAIHFRVSQAKFWPEGNDIMARLLMNMLQIEFGLEPLSVKDAEEYKKVLEAAVSEGNAEIFTSRVSKILAPVEKCPQLVSSTGSTHSINPAHEAPIKNSARILDILTLHPRYTTEDLAEVLQISAKGVEKHLAKLKKSGALLRIGPDKGGHWLVKK